VVNIDLFYSYIDRTLIKVTRVFLVKYSSQLFSLEQIKNRIHNFKKYFNKKKKKKTGTQMHRFTHE